MNAVYNINSFALRIAILLIVSLAYQAGESSISTLKKNLNENRLCQADILSNFFDEVNPSDTIIPFNTETRVRGLCHNLEYSCCQHSQIKKLSIQIQKSLSYLAFRNTYMKRLLEVINKIKESDFLEFLDHFTETDAKCFDDAQNKFYDEKIKLFENNPAIKKMLETRRQDELFKKQILIREFKELKAMLKLNIEAIEHNSEFREKYYSGMVCTLCSPNFTHHVEISQQREPLLEISKSMCKQMLQEKISTLNSLQNLNMIQKIIDLSFCARTNSQKGKDISSIRFHDLRIINPYMELIPENIKKFQRCIVNEQNFFDKENECSQFCLQSLNMMQLKMLSVDNVIYAENEIYNMFSPEAGSTNSEHRIQSQAKQYMEMRQKLIAEDLLVFAEAERIETVFVVKSLVNKTIDFSKLDIVVTPHEGLNFLDNQMTFGKFGHSAFLSVASVLFIMLFMS